MTSTLSQNRFATGGKGGSGKGGGGEPPSRDAADGAAGGAKKSKLKSKKTVLAVVGVLVLGYGGYTFLAPKKVGPPVGGDVVALDANTLNLQDGHYLKIAISVQLVKGKATTTSFYTSKAAELVIDEFSDRTVDSLSTNGARQHLTTELTGKVKAAYPGEVYDVYLTQFVTQ
jgi:flagellar FliL protein